MKQYLTFDEKEALRREIYEHQVFMAEHYAKMKTLKSEARSLRWKIRMQKFRNFLRHIALD